MTESPPADTSALVEPVVHEIPEPEAEILPLTSESINDSESEAQTVSSIEDHPDRTDEGIKVHGHWTIDVEEAGGRLVSHNEFENALVSVGADLLSQILGHQKGVGAWQVQINGPINTGICDNLIWSTQELFDHRADSTVLISEHNSRSNCRCTDNRYKQWKNRARRYRYGRECRKRHLCIYSP